MDISCFIAGAEEKDLIQTIEEINTSDSTKEIYVVGEQKLNIPNIGKVEFSGFSSTASVKAIAEKASGDFVFFYTKSLPLKIGQNAIERMCRMAQDSGAAMLYSDYYELKEGKLQAHPTIEYQDGSLRDDFDFGSLLLFKTEALKKAADEYGFGIRFCRSV